MSEIFSIAPDGERFTLPTPGAHETEFQRLRQMVENQRFLGREIVVVVGLGFVGAVMAAVIADSKNEAGETAKFVIGIQRPSTRSYWKIGWFNRGLSPIKADDPEVALMIRRCVLDKKNLVATFNEDALKLAEVCSKFEVAQEQARVDVEKFCQQLLEAGLISMKEISQRA